MHMYPFTYGCVFYNWCCSNTRGDGKLSFDTMCMVSVCPACLLQKKLIKLSAIVSMLTIDGACRTHITLRITMKNSDIIELSFFITEHGYN